MALGLPGRWDLGMMHVEDYLHVTHVERPMFIVGGPFLKRGSRPLENGESQLSGSMHSFPHRKVGHFSYAALTSWWTVPLNYEVK